MNTFVVNHKRYTARAFDFNLMCDLEDMGFAIQDIVSKPVSTARAYFALCAEMDKDEAGKELELHMIDGGKLDVVTTAMSKEMNQSGFFQYLKSNKTETEAETE